MPRDRRAGELPADQITLLWSAFDATWSAIKDRYTGSEKYADAGRLRLAKAVLAGLRAGITDAEVLNKHSRVDAGTISPYDCLVHRASILALC
jgi:hypothetical protein